MTKIHLLNYFLCLIWWVCPGVTLTTTAQPTDSAQYQITLIVKNAPPQALKAIAMHERAIPLGEYQITKSPDTIVIRNKTDQEYSLNLTFEKQGSVLLPVYKEQVDVLIDFRGVKGTIALHQSLQISGSQRMLDLQAMYHTYHWFGPLRRTYNAQIDSLYAIQASNEALAEATLKLAQLYDRKNKVLTQLLKNNCN